MQYQSVMVWSDSGMMGGITAAHVTSKAQPILDDMATKGWRVHSQSAVFAQIVGIHIIFEKD